jgi:hypothetical protein
VPRHVARWTLNTQSVPMDPGPIRKYDRLIFDESICSTPIAHVRVKSPPTTAVADVT